MEIVKTFMREDGKRRVHIERRTQTDFRFSIEVLLFDDDDEFRARHQNPEMNWAPLPPDGGIYDSLETAEREACAVERWIDRPST